MSGRRRRPVAGRGVAITGAAQGIGAAIARELAGRGARVVLGDLDAALVTQTAATLGATGHPLDVTDPASFAAFLEAATADLGAFPDALVNNAGIMWVGPFLEESHATAHRQFEVNLHGVLHGMKLALPPMVARGHGHVVNVASAASRIAPRGEATYAATKHAVLGASSAVRDELRGTGVEISLVNPGVVETELAAGTDHGRTRRLAPEDVARAVAGALERPRFEVWLPREARLLAGLLAIAPQPVRDRLTRHLVPDQLTHPDRAQRAAYEARQAG